jgi:hypothetical protein
MRFPCSFLLILFRFDVLSVVCGFLLLLVIFVRSRRLPMIFRQLASLAPFLGLHISARSDFSLRRSHRSLPRLILPVVLRLSPSTQMTSFPRRLAYFTLTRCALFMLHLRRIGIFPLTRFMSSLTKHLCFASLICLLTRHSCRFLPIVFASLSLGHCPTCRTRVLLLLPLPRRIVKFTLTH